jgi:hypothetical protein
VHVNKNNKLYHAKEITTWIIQVVREDDPNVKTVLFDGESDMMTIKKGYTKFYGNPNWSQMKEYILNNVGKISEHFEKHTYLAVKLKKMLS